MTDFYRFKVSIQDKGKFRYSDIEQDEFIIGRGKDADVQIPSDLISRHQLKVTFDGEKVWIEELGSSNGSWLDHKRLPPRRRIQYSPEQVLAIGSKEGPFLKIEAFPDVIEQEEVPDWSVHDEPEQELVTWVAPPKVVNGPDIIPALPKKVTVPPVAPAPKEKLTVVSDEMSDDQILKIQTEGEKKLFLQIKSLLGVEAEEIRNACVEEANRVRKNAEEYSLKHFKEAREKADQTLKEAEATVAKKMAELKGYEAHSLKRLEEIRSTHHQIEKSVHELKDSEVRLRYEISDLETKVRLEEDRIKEETLRLEKLKNVFQEDRARLDERMHEQEIEEEKFKVRIDSELHETNLKLADLNHEIDKAQSIKETLEPELARLKEEKASFQTMLDQLKDDEIKSMSSLELIKSQHTIAELELRNAKRDLDLTLKEIEGHRLGLLNFQKEIEENRQEADAFLKMAHVKSEEMLAEAQKSVTTLEVRRAQLQEEVESEFGKLKKEQENSIAKLVEKKAALLKEIERIAVNAHAEYHKTVTQGKEESEAIILQAKKEIETLKLQAEAEMSALKLQAEAEMSALKLQAEAEMSALKLQTEAEMSKLNDQGRVYLEERKTKADSLIEQAKLDILKDKSLALNEIAQLDVKKKSIQNEIDSALMEKEKILDEGKARVREMISDTERSSAEARRQILETAQLEAKGIIARGEAEFKENKVKQQSSLAELKHAELLKIKEIRAQAEEEWHSKRTERAKNVATNMFALVASEMYKSRNKVLDEHFVETFSKELKEVVYDTMLDKVGTDTDKLQNILKTSEDAKNKEKRFWKKVQISAACTAAALLIVLVFPQVLLTPRDMIISAFQPKKSNDSDVFLEKVKEARVRAFYNPATTVEYKTSYVDNVLYTTDYLSKLNAEAFQDKWILELNDWFIRDLDVKDTTIIKFVSLESNLLKELEQMKTQIDVQNPSPGIEIMRKREAEFQQKLADIFADQMKVPRYYEFSKKFWNDHHNPRRPASN